MEKTLRILIPEYLPLLNKGEEAIARGLQDILEQGRPVKLAVLGKQDKISRQTDITVFPLKWLYRLFLIPIQAKLRTAMWLSKVFQYRLGMYGRAWNLCHSGRMYQPLHDYFRECDLVVMGHDGVFSVEGAAVLHVAKQYGKRAGILGCSVARNKRFVNLYAPLYRMVMQEADFCFFREQSSYEFMKALDPKNQNIQLAPDPAFAMKPASEQEAVAILENYNWYKQAHAQDRQIVCLTVCQKSIVYDYSFLNTPVGRKSDVHAEFIAGILDGLARENNVHYVFLPHSIEHGIGNDLNVAEKVKSRLRYSADRATIIRENLSARQLKAIVRQSAFLIGERTHSLIGAVDVATPFVALCNTRDLRTHGIIGQMCGLERLIFDMDSPVISEAIKMVQSAFEQRASIRESLQKTSVELRRQLARVARAVLGEGPVA